MLDFILKPWHLVVVFLASHLHREQERVIEYLQIENEVLREKLGKKRILLSDDQRRRLLNTFWRSSLRNCVLMADPLWDQIRSIKGRMQTELISMNRVISHQLAGEWRGGISPPRSLRTGRARLHASGSHLSNSSGHRCQVNSVLPSQSSR